MSAEPPSVDRADLAAAHTTKTAVDHSAAWNRLPPLEFDPARIGPFHPYSEHYSPAFGQSIRVMAAKVQHLAKRHGWSRILVTAPAANCGKSTICANLAMSLAQHGNRVVMVDLDRRGARLLNIFGAGKIKGPAPQKDAAAGALHNTLRRMGPNLAIGAVRSDPENLKPPEAGEAVAPLSKIKSDLGANYLILNGSPGALAPDVAAQIDCSLIVVAAGQSTLPEVRRCVSHVSALTNVLGVILNKAVGSAPG